MTSDAPAAPPRLSEIVAAARRISPMIHHTPVEHCPHLSDIAGVPVYLKLECWQRTRSFKIRGAANALLQLAARIPGARVTTASAGNHGQAVALAARQAHLEAMIFVPSSTPELKKRRIRGYGAFLDETQPDYDSAEAASRAWAHENGAHFVSAFSDHDVAAGQGTIALEIIEDLPDVQDVVVPVGGGGLSSGIGFALRALAPHVRMHGVQTSETRAMHDAFKAGRIVDSPITPTLAEGLAGCTDATAYAWLSTLIDHVDLVPEENLASTIRTLYEQCGVIAEGSGAVAACAVQHGVVKPRGPTVVVVSGGNVDASRLATILSA